MLEMGETTTDSQKTSQLFMGGLCYKEVNNDSEINNSSLSKFVMITNDMIQEMKV
jgi:hypothetical protein